MSKVCSSLQSSVTLLCVQKKWVHCEIVQSYPYLIFILSCSLPCQLTFQRGCLEQLWLKLTSWVHNFEAADSPWTIAAMFWWHTNSVWSGGVGKSWKGIFSCFTVLTACVCASLSSRSAEGTFQMHMNWEKVLQKFAVLLLQRTDPRWKIFLSSLFQKYIL